MKVIKPLRLGVLTRPFETRATVHFAVGTLTYFSLGPSPRVYADVDLWKALPDVLPKDTVLDMGMPKSRAEVLLAAKAFPTGGPRAACNLRVRVGSIDKTLRAVGDRTWHPVTGALSNIDAFTEMPVTWQRAFGGEGFTQNPLGKGFAATQTDRGKLHPMPNIEDPRRPVTSGQDRHPPVGFLPYDMSWPQRMAKVGTYDERWMRERYPGFPDDIDWTYFNGAPDDQQQRDFFKGDEAFTLEGMHPSRPVLEGRLPGVTSRVFVTMQGAEDELREIPVRAETVWFFPHIERGLIIHRGTIEINEDDGTDVLTLMLACERLGEPRTVDYYRQVHADRLDFQRGGMMALRDRDLMPPKREGDTLEGPQSHLDEMAALAPTGILRQNMRRRAEKELQVTRAKIAELGVDPDAVGVPSKLPPEPPPPTLDELPDEVERLNKLTVELRADAEKQGEDAMKRMNAMMKEAGFDPDAAAARGKRDGAGPPKFRAQTEMDRARQTIAEGRAAGLNMAMIEGQLLDPKYEAKLVEVERRLREMYRIAAHHQDPAARLGGDEATRAREEILTAIARGESLVDRDFTGVHLAGADLVGADLRGAFLESADLTGANLQGADLTGAVLARAELTGANLTNAKLTSANLGKARLVRAKFDGADLDAAVLYGADLMSASFRGAKMKKVDLSEASFLETDFTEAVATELTLLKCDLSGLEFTGADLSKSNFLEASIEGSNFTRATLTGAVFIDARGDGACFRDAKADNIRALGKSSLARADFTGASLVRANFRGTKLVGASFAQSNLDGADLSECDLTGASFHRASAVEARFVKSDLTDAVMLSTNLMMSILQKARIQGANFHDANLFRADMARIRGAAKDLSGANTTHVRVLPKAGA